MAQAEDFSDDDSDIELEASLQNILDQESLKWIFVGGKGGVGKTTTSCSLAVMLAQKREKVLIISTDPAHNLSDAFAQQFSAEETQVNGVDNLYAMEINPKVNFAEFGDEFVENKSVEFLSELSSSVPGIDEAMSFAELMKQIKRKHYSTIVFDTAPTGHTLRLLSFPEILQKAITKLDGLRSKFGGLFNNLTSMLGNQGGSQMMNPNALADRMAEMRENVEAIKHQFEDPNLTTFVCVCIPEFLSLYETERLVMKLAKFGIDTHNIVINQILFPEKDSKCKRCEARVRMQQKYISQFNDLYADDFHLIQMPLMSDEVRHIQKLKQFAHLLCNPYENMTDSQREALINIGNNDSDTTTPAITSNAGDTTTTMASQATADNDVDEDIDID